MNYIKVEKSIKHLIEKEDICYVNLMKMFDQLACDYLYIMQYYPDILEIDDTFQNRVSYFEILKQVLKFMKSINLEYYISLKNAYKIKQINIDLEKKEEAYCEYRKNTKFINWPINYNIDDSFSLIHEFLHYLNLDKNVILTRQYFTETFSFLFEMLLYDYLDYNNYHNKEYLKIKLIKFADCFDCANELYNYGNLIDLYLKNSKLNDKIIEENYHDKKLQEKVKQMCYSYQNGLSFFKCKKYLLGIFISCDIHQQLLKKPDYMEKVFYLMKNINQIRLNSFFKELNIKIVNQDHSLNFDDISYNRILNNLKIELDDAYKKFKEVENEKNYCYCRTNSCWQNKIEY